MLTFEIKEEADLIMPKLERYSLSSLIKGVCEQFDIDREELLSRRRQSSLVKPRHIMYYLGYKHTGYSLPKLGSMLDRDHTSILYAKDKIAKQILDPNSGIETQLLVNQTHLLAMMNEEHRQTKLEQYRNEVNEMIDRINTERLNGL